MTPQQQIYAKENEIRLLRLYETAFVVDEDGNIVLEKTSDTAYEIEFADAEISAMQAALNPVFTHNHPRGWNFSSEDAQHRGSSFSPNDIELACKAHLTEIRAVSPKYRFSMRPATNRFQSSDWQAIGLVFDVEHALVKKEMGTAVMQGQLSREAYHGSAWRRCWDCATREQRSKSNGVHNRWRAEYFMQRCVFALQTFQSAHFNKLCRFP